MTTLFHTRMTVSQKTILALMSVGALALGAGPLYAQTPAVAPPPTAPPAAAEAKAPVKISVAARIGTLGVGLEGSALVSPFLAVRVGFNSYSYSHSASYQGLDYDGKLKLNSVAALADFYPAPSSTFHVTAGLVFDNNKITARGKPNASGNTQTYTLDGTDYNVSDVGSLDGRVTFAKTAPYLGVGFGKPAGGSSGLRFLFDVGVVFQGKPRLSLDRNGGNPTLPAALNDQINAAVIAQRDKTQSDVDKYRYYPVVSLGLAYGF